MADRFHLLENASHALDDLRRTRSRFARLVPLSPPPEPPASTTREAHESTAAPTALSAAERQRAKRRAARIARWEDVKQRGAAGLTVSHIARELGQTRKTIRRWLAPPAPPPAPYVIRTRPGGLRSPMLQPYLAHLQERWQEGCTDTAQLFREFGERGYEGSYSLVRAALRPWRTLRPPPRCERPRLSAHRLCLCPPEQPNADERELLDRALAEDAELARGYELLQRLRRLVAERDVAMPETRLVDAQLSEPPSFVQMANAIRVDRAALEAGLTTPWSTSPLEDYIHRVKVLKRQGDGRANFDLLERRVPAACTAPPTVDHRTTLLSIPTF